MPTNFIITDSEWSPKTGEFFTLGVKIGDKPTRSYDLHKGPGRKIKLVGHWIVYYWYAPRDIEAFRMKFEGDFEFRDIYHVFRLSRGNPYSNVSTPRENKERMPGMHQLYCGTLGDKIPKPRDDRHTYARYDKQILNLVKHDVDKTYAVMKHFDLFNAEVQPVISKWSRNAENYISVCRPVQMEKSYLNRINNPDYLRKLVQALEDGDPNEPEDARVRCNAFTVKTILKPHDLLNGYPTLALKRSKWLDFCKEKGWTQFLDFEKRQDGTTVEYAHLRKDDFADFDKKLDNVLNIRSSESAAPFETYVHLITIIRTGHMRFENIVPFVHPHHTQTGRSGQLQSPYVSGGLVRSNIYAGDGRAIVSVDLKSQEFCIAAAASDCPGMWLLAEHNDPYMQLAPLFGIDPKTAGKGQENRDAVKVPVLQMLYGGGAGLIFNGITSLKEEKKDLMLNLKDKFPGFFAWQDEQLALAHERGYVGLPDGFKLWVESETMNPRQCGNMLIQGLAASIMPAWMDEVNRVIPKTAYISAELYDGLYVNCELSDVDTVMSSLLETSGVWDKYVPLHRLWKAEIVENFETHEKFHVHGVKEKAKYLKMDKVFADVERNYD